MTTLRAIIEHGCAVSLAIAIGYVVVWLIERWHDG